MIEGDESEKEKRRQTMIRRIWAFSWYLRKTICRRLTMLGGADTDELSEFVTVEWLTLGEMLDVG